METKLTKEYVKGFNQSYLLAMHKPSLLAKIVKTENKNLFLQGMKDGKQVYENEISKDNSRKQSRLDELNQNRDFENGIDLER